MPNSALAAEEKGGAGGTVSYARPSLPGELKCKWQENGCRPNHRLCQQRVHLGVARFAQQYVEGDRSWSLGLQLFDNPRMQASVPRPFPQRCKAGVIDIDQ